MLSATVSLVPNFLAPESLKCLLELIPINIIADASPSKCIACSFLKQARSQVDSNPGDARNSGRIQPLTQQQNDIRKESQENELLPDPSMRITGIIPGERMERREFSQAWWAAYCDNSLPCDPQWASLVLGAGPACILMACLIYDLRLM
eukprot:1137973-Pelagomonas_calceolata.AAC.2